MVKTNYYIGLMSGTSMDGIDAALVEIHNNEVQLVDTLEYPWPADILAELRSYRDHAKHDLVNLGQLDVHCGELFGHSCLALMAKAGLRSDDIEAIGSHGQTLLHHPDSQHSFSLQIGDPNRIAELTGITTVADFRRRDMAAGGQGAPLTPAFHQAIFQDSFRNRAIVNIGGIANITWLPADSGRIKGFDTGPGNCLMDTWIQRTQNLPFDADGHFASTGKIHRQLLNSLLKDPYFSMPAPKSTGTEYFSIAWLLKHLSALPTIEAADVQATLLELSAHTITTEIKRLDAQPREIIICGGGAHNSALMNRLQDKLGQVAMFSSEKLGIPPDWVEAMAFAWMAHAALNGLPANRPEVTGASGTRILGAIYPGTMSFRGQSH